MGKQKMAVCKLLLGAAGLTVAYAVMRELSLVSPEGINPVRQFDLSCYLGKWYEVGRLENRFERGLVRSKTKHPAQ